MPGIFAWLANKFAGLWMRFGGGKRDVRICMVGLDAAGKTTVLYKLKLGEVVHTIPTIGFNVDSVEYKNIAFTVWDIGGQDKIRPLWRHYYNNSGGIIFVVDSNDHQRVDESSDGRQTSAADELHKMLGEDDLRGVPVLVLANKQDMHGAMSVKDVSQRLQMDRIRDRQWHVQGTCATTGDGLFEGLDWLAQVTSEKR